MVTGELKSQIDKIWNGFWSGGIANPLEVMEQLTYLLFIKRLDDLQTLEENYANSTGEAMRRVIFPKGKDDKAARTRTCGGVGWEIIKELHALEDEIKQGLTDLESML